LYLAKIRIATFCTGVDATTLTAGVTGILCASSSLASARATLSASITSGIAVGATAKKVAGRRASRNYLASIAASDATGVATSAGARGYDLTGVTASDATGVATGAGARGYDLTGVTARTRACCANLASVPTSNAKNPSITHRFIRFEVAYYAGVLDVKIKLVRLTARRGRFRRPRVAHHHKAHEPRNWVSQRNIYIEAAIWHKDLPTTGSLKGLDFK
jgi:hypothetical protein